jgi:hypothetical protein
MRHFGASRLENQITTLKMRAGSKQKSLQKLQTAPSQQMPIQSCTAKKGIIDPA